MSEIDYNSKNYKGKHTGYVKHVVEKPTKAATCNICDGHGQIEAQMVKDGQECNEVRTCGKCNGSGEGSLFVYGFIEPDDRTIDDVFAHHREIEPLREGFKELGKGDYVQFELVVTDRGPCAQNIVVIERRSLKRRIIREGENVREYRTSST